MTPLVLAVAALGLLASSGLAQTSEPAASAARSGRIIGGAAGCGLPQGELDRASRKASAAMRASTKGAAELKRVEDAHRAAFEAEAARVEKAGEPACGAAVDAFRAFGRERG